MDESDLVVGKIISFLIR